MSSDTVPSPTGSSADPLLGLDGEPLRIGVLTSGGDAQGMNAAVRAVVRTAIRLGARPYAVMEGWAGAVAGGNGIRPLEWDSVGSILQRGGTIIGTARSAEFRERAGQLAAARNLLEHGIDRLVVIGGDGSLTGTNEFRKNWPSLLEELVATGDISAQTAAAHPVSGDLVDTGSGLRLEEGRMTALVCPDPQVSADLATRLGRFTDAGPTVTLAGRPLTTMPLEQVRASVVVSGATAQLFTGTLREALDVRGGPDPQPAGLEDLVRAETERTTGADVDQQVRPQEREAPGDDRLIEAIGIADAGDVLTSLSEGLAGMITEKGRSLSGGQRQRVALARALLTEAPTLVLIEPTSALDSHTEARVAAQVHRARAGRTTVVVTASPLVLEACDEVVLLDSSGTELLRSTHRELMAMARDGHAQAADYRAVVSRAMGEDAEASC